MNCDRLITVVVVASLKKHFYINYLNIKVKENTTENANIILFQKRKVQRPIKN